MDAKVKQHLVQAREYYQAGDYERAHPHLDAVLAVHDDYADIHNMLGVVHYEGGRPQLARESFERALAINAHYTEAALNLSVIYNELGKYDEARAIYEQARGPADAGGLDRLDSFARGKIANLHRDLGDAYVSVHLLDHAVREFKKALAVCPTFVDIRTKLANTLRDAGRLDDALDEYEGICESSPTYIPARIHYGVTLWRADRVAEAREQWQEVLSREPTNRSCTVYMKMTAAGARPSSTATATGNDSPAEGDAAEDGTAGDGASEDDD